MKVPRSVLHAMLAGGLSLLLASALSYIAHLDQQRDSAGEQLQLGSQAGELRAQLLNELNSTLYLASGLVSYLQGKDGAISPREIQPWLQNMTRQTRMIRAIAIAPDNRIKIIYPLQGNEAAIGLYYPDVPGQWSAVQQAILSRSPILTGPVQLKQGGEALIYRTPVFLSDSRYWGMVSTVLNLSPLLDQTRKMADEKNLSVSLTSQPEAANPAFMLGDASSMNSASIRLQIALPASQWLLGVSRASEHPTSTSMTFLHGLGLLISLLLGGLTWLMLRAAERRNLAQSAFLESRQRFTQAFETAPQNMTLITPKKRWIEVNNRLCELLGFASHELHGMNLWQVLPDDQRSKARQQLRDARQQPQQWETCLVDKQDQPIDCQLSAAWLQGESASIILQCQDIRESKRLSRLKNEFVSTVSHELRTPLTSIAGALDLIGGGALGDVPPAMRGMLDIARQNSQRRSLLINDLLDMEKLNAGKLRCELSRQSLHQQLQEALASNSSYAEPLGVRYHLQESADVEVEVDALRLQQVLSNLLSNATKFAPRGTQVSVRWECTNEHVRVSVHDQGAGIPVEFHERIFSKFSQADSSDKREQGGTGLGLAISKKLIELMHGRIGFISEPGTGTTFWFELPLLTPASTETTGLPRLLIVEDDDELAQLLKALLDSHGYASRRVSTLEAARVQLAEENISALILDLHLPDGHGASLLREIRGATSGQLLPVIILSAFCAEGQRLLADLPGPIDWLDKPLHTGELLQRLALRLQQPHRPRVLHVEDDADVRAVIAAQAARLADFEGAASLAEARLRLQSQRYQLLLLDLELPDGSGLDLLQEVQCNQPQLPVIILSTHDVSHAQRLSAQAVITKSRYAQTELLELLRQHLHHPTGNHDVQP